jgi:hypothetical protein
MADDGNEMAESVAPLFKPLTSGPGGSITVQPLFKPFRNEFSADEEKAMRAPPVVIRSPTTRR